MNKISMDSILGISLHQLKDIDWKKEVRLILVTKSHGCLF